MQASSTRLRMNGPKNKITTPEEAIEHIRTISNQSKTNEKKTTQSYASTRRNVRREKLP